MHFDGVNKDWTNGKTKVWIERRLGWYGMAWHGMEAGVKL